MAANNVVTTSFTISFGGSGGNAILKAEVDDRTNGLNGGNTSFAPGDKVGWLLFKTSQGDLAVTVDGIASSYGNNAALSSSTKEVKETLQFANERTATLGYPCPGAIKSYQWIGKDLGSFTKVDEVTITLSKPASEFIPTDPQVGILEVVYDAPCDQYMLENTLIAGKSTYEILVFIAGHTAASS